MKSFFMSSKKSIIFNSQALGFDINFCYVVIVIKECIFDEIATVERFFISAQRTDTKRIIKKIHDIYQTRPPRPINNY
ncbi:hypothetical protein FE74_14795, partial [Staphylococcus aureus]